MNTTGLFSKNGNIWQPAGFDRFDSVSELWVNDDCVAGLCGGNSFLVKIGKAGRYSPMIQLKGQGVYEGEPSASLSTAKKRAVEMAMKNRILFDLKAKPV